MARNNHNAGMHYIRYHGWFGDEQGYDRYIDMVDEGRRRQRMNQFSIDRNNNVEATAVDFSNISGKDEEVELPVQEGKGVKADKKELAQGEIQNMKNDSASQVQDNTTKKKKQHRQGRIEPEYGTESVIDIEHFLFHPEANIMKIAIQKKKNIYQILKDCEALMKRDIRTNPDPQSNRSMPVTVCTSIFYSLLAEKLDCSIQEFFMCDKDANKRFVYSLLDELDKIDIDNLEWSFDIDEEDDGYASLSIPSFDYFYGMVPDGKRYAEGDYRQYNMDLELTREKIDGEYYYAISFGDLTIYRDILSNYMIKGAYLLEEEEGKLKDFFERKLKQRANQKDVDIVIVNCDDKILLELRSGIDEKCQYGFMELEKTQAGHELGDLTVGLDKKYGIQCEMNPDGKEIVKMSYSDDDALYHLFVHGVSIPKTGNYPELCKWVTKEEFENLTLIPMHKKCVEDCLVKTVFSLFFKKVV